MKWFDYTNSAHCELSTVHCLRMSCRNPIGPIESPTSYWLDEQVYTVCNNCFGCSMIDSGLELKIIPRKTCMFIKGRRKWASITQTGDSTQQRSTRQKKRCQKIQGIWIVFHCRQSQRLNSPPSNLLTSSPDLLQRKHCLHNQHHIWIWKEHFIR